MKLLYSHFCQWRAYKIYKKIYPRFDLGFHISKAHRTQHPKLNHAEFVYGEVLFKSFWQYLNNLNFPDNQNFNFYDLGAGLGKPAVIAALSQRFNNIYAIELIEDLIEAGRGNIDCYLNNKSSFIKPLKINNSLRKINWRHEDIFQSTVANRPQGHSVIFINGAGFHNDRLQELLSSWEDLLNNSLLLIASKKVCDKNWKLEQESYIDMSWGQATMRCYRFNK